MMKYIQILNGELIEVEKLPTMFNNKFGFDKRDIATINSENFFELIEPTLLENEIKLPVLISDKSGNQFIQRKEVNENYYLEQETKKYIQRTKDGVNAYAQISAKFRLAKLSGQVNEEQLYAVEQATLPIRTEIMAGQWITGLSLLEQLGVSIGEDLYDELHQLISSYIEQNY